MGTRIVLSLSAFSAYQLREVGRKYRTLFEESKKEIEEVKGQSEEFKKQAEEAQQQLAAQAMPSAAAATEDAERSKVKLCNVCSTACY